MSRRTLGWIALAVSTVMWLAVFVIPFTPLETAQKVSLGAGLYGGSWVLFIAAIAAIGKESYDAMKRRLADRLRRRPDP